MPEDSALRRRQHAAVAGHTGDAGTARSLTTDPDAKVRATALAALSRSGAIESREIEAALTDPSPVVRRRACELAIAFDHIDLVPRLTDDEPTVVEQAAWALGERADRAGHHAVEALSTIVTTHDDALCREAAVAALGAIGDPQGLPAILHATRDKPPIRRRAIIALAPFEGPEVDEAMERAKTDRDWQVRQAAEDLTGDGPAQDPAPAD